MESNRYDHIINLPRHTSKHHPPMSRENRAAQFSPFAALTGYDDLIAESDRQTDERQILDDDDKASLNDRINILLNNISDRPAVSIRFFVADKRKSGGTVQTISGNIRLIEPIERIIVLTDGTRISLDDVLDISSELFSKYGLY